MLCGSAPKGPPFGGQGGEKASPGTAYKTGQRLFVDPTNVCLTTSACVVHPAYRGLDKLSLLFS